MAKKSTPPVATTKVTRDEREDLTTTEAPVAVEDATTSPEQLPEAVLDANAISAALTSFDENVEADIHESAQGTDVVTDDVIFTPREDSTPQAIKEDHIVSHDALVTLEAIKEEEATAKETPKPEPAPEPTPVPQPEPSAPEPQTTDMNTGTTSGALTVQASSYTPSASPELSDSKCTPGGMYIDGNRVLDSNGQLLGTFENGEFVPVEEK